MMTIKNKNKNSISALIGSQVQASKMLESSTIKRAGKTGPTYRGVSPYQTLEPKMKYNAYANGLENKRLHFDQEVKRLRQKPFVIAFESGVAKMNDAMFAEKDIPRKIADIFLGLEDIMGVNYYNNKENHNFTIIFRKDRDDIANTIAEIDNQIYTIYPNFDHEINYVIYDETSSSPLFSYGTLYKKE